MAETKRITLPDEKITHRQNPGSIVVATGTVTLDGSNPTSVACLATHGIGAVLGATATMYGTAPVDADSAQISITWSGSTLNIYAWKWTGGTTDAWSASTVSDVVISYVVVGTV